MLEKIAHVHPEAALPPYTSKTFVARAQKKNAPKSTEPPRLWPAQGRDLCHLLVNYNDPDLGMIARAVLAKNGVKTEVVYPSCCGMPQLEQGDIAHVVANARKVASELQPWIAKGYDIIALVPSSALMLKLEWPLLVPQRRSRLRQAIETFTSDV